MGERMNVIASSSIAHPTRHSSVFGNLIRKECLESRGVVIAGLAIFWLVPAVLGLFELALAGRRDVFPFAWLVVIAAGWLYAVIVGAHTVCRDWGKAEEHFLLAQPASPRTVVCAKLITGASAVALVLAIAVAWDAMFIRETALAAADKPEWLLMIFSAACMMFAGYVLAFAVAVMTRQMLASIVVATLVLIVWAIAPLFSFHLARFWAPALLLGEQHLTAVAPFVLVSFLILAVGIMASFYYSTSERTFRLGNKQLAWTIGLVMLALFGVAMSEVGNSLHVRDQAVFQAVFAGPGLSVRGLAWTIQRGDHFFITYCDYQQQSHPEMAKWFMATFRVSDSGHIQDLRRTPIPGMLPPVNSGLQNPAYNEDQLTVFAFDKDGHVILSGSRLRPDRSPDALETVWRTTLTWPDGGELKVLSHAELALPAGEHFRTPVSWYESWHEGRDHAPRFAYLTSVVASSNDNDVSYREDKLYVFDWSDGPNPGPRYRIPLPQDDLHVSVSNGKVRVYTVSGHFPNQQVFAADFDADRPETLLDKQNWSLHERPNWREDQLPPGFERFGEEYIPTDERGDVAYLSDRLGLRVARQTHPGHWEIVGQCRTSPLSMLFRGVARPQALDDALAIEYSVGGIIAYDVSNPSNPKRIGFFNAVGLLWLDRSVFTTGRYLVLREDDVITVLDRPVTGKP
jgi:hypothetical protein